MVTILDGVDIELRLIIKKNSASIGFRAQDQQADLTHKNNIYLRCKVDPHIVSTTKVLGK